MKKYPGTKIEYKVSAYRYPCDETGKQNGIGQGVFVATNNVFESREKAIEVAKKTVKRHQPIKKKDNYVLAFVSPIETLIDGGGAVSHASIFSYKNTINGGSIENYYPENEIKD